MLVCSVTLLLFTQIRGDLFVIDKLWYLDIINYVGVLN
jgi:hypothetical protein